jgi:hypothetical protein
LLPVAAAEAAKSGTIPKSSGSTKQNSEEELEEQEQLDSELDLDISKEEAAAVMSLPTVLLFVRPQRDEYACFGRLEASTVEELDGQLCVSWKLVDYSAIESSAPFQHVLKLQK